MTFPAQYTTMPLPEPDGTSPYFGEFLGHLPLARSSFVGRAREVATLGEALSARRLVTLTGPSGMGKTRLALEVAMRHADGYRGGAWLIDLSPVTEPALVPQVVTAAVGLPLEPGRDATDALIDRLGSRGAILLVLDNCEHLLSACSALVERIFEATDNVVILATSQLALELDGEHVVALSPMSLPERTGEGLVGSGWGTADEALAAEAVALFCARASSASPPFRLTDDAVPAVIEICRRLDGIPLAIELAAARAGVLSPVDIAERLADRFALLTQGGGEAPARHQTLRAALDWSYDLLSEPQAVLLRRLSVFTAGCTLRAAEGVCVGGPVDRSQILDLVSELVARSLVTADISGPRARYRLLETVREYGRRRLAEAGELAAVSACLAQWCLGVMEQSWHQVTLNDQQWIETLEADVENLRAALDWCTSGGDPQLGLRLASAVTPFWKQRGSLREGQDWLKRALEACPEGNPGYRTRALWGLGMLAILQGDVVAATPALEESLTLARAAQLPRAEAQALNMLGFVSIFNQDPLSALPLLEESVALARTVSDPSILANALLLYGRAHIFLGDADAARQVFEECMEVELSEGEQWPGGALIGLGWTSMVAGERRRAQEFFSRALPGIRAEGEPFETALVLSFLGELAWARGDLAQARSLLDEAWTVAQTIGAPFPQVRSQAGMARVALSESRVEDAQALADQACAIARGARLPYAYVRCLQVQGIVRVASDDIDGARVSFEEALETARENFDEGGIAGALHLLGRLGRGQGYYEQATSMHSEALSIQVRIPDAAGIASSLEAMAGLAVSQGRHARAARLFGAAQVVREECGSPRQPDEVRRFEVDVARLSAESETAMVEEAWAEGAGLSRTEAVALATRGRGSRDRPVQGLEALTPTERQVIELAAAGLTNAEIGDRLFVSFRTAQGHLLRAFPKLGVKSRRQLKEMYPEL